MNPYQQYKTASLNTMSSGEILVKLYDEALLQLRQTKISIEKKDFYSVNESLTKAKTIIDTLHDSLDARYPISEQLSPIYLFISEQILQANISKDVELIDEISGLVRELRDSFQQADRLSRQQQSQQRMVASYGGAR